MQYLCELDEIENFGSKGFNLEGVPLFLVRQNEKVFAYLNSCPHLGVPLEWFEDKFLDSDAELIQCSTHGALFTIHSGLCVSGPCSGQTLSALNTVIKSRQVWVEPPQQRS